MPTPAPSDIQPPGAVVEDENLWSRILTEVQSRSSSVLPQAGMLVLGDNDSGKTSLIARLQHNEDPKKGSGLEYHYIEVNPDYRDGTYAYQLGSALPDVGPGESARLGVWVLDGDPVYAPLMRFSLSQETLERSLVILTASMASPWSIMDALQRWSRILQDQLDNSSFYDRNVLKESRDRQTRFWQEYVEPLDSSSHSDAGAKVPSMETEHVLLPLGNAILTHNTGLSIVVVVTKPVPKDAEVQAEDDQGFLTKQQTVFAQSPSPQPSKPQNQESPMLQRPKSSGPSQVSPAAPPQKKPEGVKIPPQMSVPGGGQNSEGVLAAFFNNLLKTKPGPNGPTPASPGSPLNSSRSFDAKTNLNADAEAELARMLTESSNHSADEAKQIAAQTISAAKAKEAAAAGK